MNISIIGGTSHVATELCAILRDWGHTVTPTARSRVSASFLNEQEFDPVIGDVTDRDTMRRTVAGADVIVIAAFARQYSKGFSPKQAHRTNEAIVTNAVTEAPDDASLVYFSTIGIYGEETGFSRFDSYAYEKKRIEGEFLEACDDHGKDGFVFRMGPVYGPNQGNTRALRSTIARETRDGELHIDIGHDRLSNVVHTVTIGDAITTVQTDAVDGEVFTVVNHPQWTWGDVLGHYVPGGTELVFHPRSDGGSSGFAGRLLSAGSELLESNERSLRSLSVYFPRRLNDRIFNEYVKRKTRSTLGEFDSRGRLELGQFEQESVPGDRIPGLSETEELLRNTDDWAESFRTVHEIETRSSGSIVNF